MLEDGLAGCLRVPVFVGLASGGTCALRDLDDPPFTAGFFVTAFAALPDSFAAPDFERVLADEAGLAGLPDFDAALVFVFVTLLEPAAGCAFIALAEEALLSVPAARDSGAFAAEVFVPFATVLAPAFPATLVAAFGAVFGAVFGAAFGAAFVAALVISFPAPFPSSSRLVCTYSLALTLAVVRETFFAPSSDATPVAALEPFFLPAPSGSAPALAALALPLAATSTLSSSLIFVLTLAVRFEATRGRSQSQGTVSSDTSSPALSD